MKKLITIFLSISYIITFSQSKIIGNSEQVFSINDTIYFDEFWDISNSKSYNYYRLSQESNLQYKDQNLIEVTDYFKDGQKQMTGYLTQTDSSMKKALFTYYNAKGQITQFRLYDYDLYIDQFPKMLEFANLIDSCNIENKYLIVQFYPKKIRTIGFKNAEMRSIGLWRYYKKNGKYVTANFKHGVDPTVIRYYDKKNRLIRKGYYVRRSK
jgi:hypothetical protein